MYIILRAADNLKMILAPILPHTPVLTHRTQKLHEYLGYGGQLSGAQHVVEYEEAARLGGLRSHRALTYWKSERGAGRRHSEIRELGPKSRLLQVPILRLVSDCQH